MKVKLGGRGLTHPAGDPGMVGGGAELFTESAMGILPHLLSPGLRLDLIFNIMLNKEFQWDKWERQHISQTALLVCKHGQNLFSV